MNDEVVQLHDLIHERTGLVLWRQDGLDAFARRIAAPFEKSGCGSLTEYIERLRSTGSDSDEWSDIIDEFSRTSSPFYRHERLMRLIVGSLIPRLIEDRNGKLRIWSAACSTGEEPLVIAMTLADAGLLERYEIEIDASDANANSVEHAQRGIYTRPRIDTLSKELRDRYFSRSPEGWQADPRLHARINWSVANLMNESEIADKASSDLIFCRNVFIYFADAAIERTVFAFHKHMPPGGCLVSDQGEYHRDLVARMGIFEREVLEDFVIWRKG